MPALRPNLLLVEDDPSLRMLLSTILTKSGYRVRASEDGFSALKRIRDETPEIVLSDLLMPGMSGFEFLSVVRRRFPEIRVVAMSSAYSGVDIPKGVAADAFYEKATDLPALLAMIVAIRQETSENRKQAETAAPLWIAREQENSRGERCVQLSCTDCLRTFSQAIAESVSVICEACCPYCAMTSRYALVQPTELDHRA